MERMVLAAIDIGSNAIRLMITRFLGEEKKNKKLEYIRFPLRLGKDVFQTGEITYRNEMKFIELLSAFKTLINLYDVDDFYGCATSAMRESKNGMRILERAYDQSGLFIDTIDGRREAELIGLAIKPQMRTDRNYLNIDVGGGSTELSFFKGDVLEVTQSFKLGSVRNMHGKDDPQEWERMKDWIKKHCEHRNGELIKGIGTGGNITKFLDFVDKSSGKKVDVSQIEEITEHIKSFSIEERINRLHLRADRADVIVHAAQIYLTALKTAEAEKIIIPSVGLKDGIIEMLKSRNLN